MKLMRYLLLLLISLPFLLKIFIWIGLFNFQMDYIQMVIYTVPSTLFLIYHAVKNPQIVKDYKAAWIAGFVCANPFGQLFYWFRYLKNGKDLAPGSKNEEVVD